MKRTKGTEPSNPNLKVRSVKIAPYGYNCKISLLAVNTFWFVSVKRYLSLKRLRNTGNV